MPRDGSGNYTLPQAAFVPNTTISSSAVNSDFSDIATALTGSVAADGQTPITAPIEFVSGTAADPGVKFSDASGVFLSTAGVLGFSAGGIAVSYMNSNVQGTGHTGNQFYYANGAILMPVGSIIDYAGPTAPSGWIFCYGQAISRTGYPELFFVIGTNYGNGDGTSTFNLPDLRGRATFGRDDMGGTAANRITNAESGIVGTTLGASGGVQSVTLTIAQLAAHTHTFTGSALSGHTHSVTGNTGTESANHTHSGTTSTESAPHTHSGTTGGESNTHIHSGTTGGQSADHTHSGTTATESASHTHSGTTGGQSADHTHTGTTTTDGAHTHTVPIAIGSSGAAGAGNSLVVATNTTTSSNGAHNHTFTSNGVSGGHVHDFTSGTESASHTHTITTGGVSGGHVHAFDSGIEDTGHTHAFTSSTESAAHTHSVTTGTESLAHTHAISLTTSSDSAGTPAGSNSSTGGGTSHSNIPPAEIMNKIIFAGRP